VGTEVTLGPAGRSGRGYLSEPALTGPGVVVVHDEYGLLPHVRRRCDWLAGGLDQLRARGMVAIAATQLLARPKVRPQRVGAVGFGPGGRLALLAATTGALDVLVAFYAVLAPAERSLVPCPALLHLTGGPDEQDATVRSFLHELRTSGTELTVRTWSGVPPGFANADRPDYREKPAVAAWVETAGFLAGHLRS
jgi:dienelactone hydrolase